MKNMNFTLAITIFLLSNCTNKNIIKAYKQTENNNSVQISGIDNSSKVQWRIANDDKKLYFKFESSDKSIQRMLLFNGFTIIIDTTGHKKENITLKYNNHKENQTPGTFNNRPDSRKLNFNTTESFKELLCKDENSEMLIDFQLDKSDYSATYKIDSFEVITCNVVIPLNSLNPNGLKSLNKISVCLKIERGQKPQHRDGEELGEEGGMGNMGGGMGRSSSGGGMGGGMGRGGRHGGGGGGRMDVGSNNSGSGLVEFWFKTELAK